MIIKWITIKGQREKRTEILQTLVSMIEPTCKEEGCMNYRIHIDIEDESVFSLVALWRNREDLNRHIRSNRFGVLLGTKSLLREPLKIWIYTVSNSEGMEAVNEARGKRT